MHLWLVATTSLEGGKWDWRNAEVVSAENAKEAAHSVQRKKKSLPQCAGVHTPAAVAVRDWRDWRSDEADEEVEVFGV